MNPGDETGSRHETSDSAGNAPSDEGTASSGKAERVLTEAERYLLSQNKDYIGWLTVDGTNVDYPVVQGDDNTYYLNHNFLGQPEAAGTLFADSEVGYPETGNLLIYGHHMKDGSMFGSLKKFEDRTFFEEHGYIRWESGGESEIYEVFAVLVVSGEKGASGYLPLQEYLCEKDPRKQAENLREIASHSLYLRTSAPTTTPVPALTGNDSLLFLVTCDYTRTNGRLLVCAKKQE